MRFLKFLLIIILICLPLGELARVDFGNNIAFKLLDIAVLITSIYWFAGILINKGNNKIRTDYKKIFNRQLIYLLFPAIGLLALIFNLNWLGINEFFTSLLYLIRWLSYLSIYFIVRNFDKKFKTQIINYLFIDGLIIVILGFIQYFFFNSLKGLYYAGWDEHLHRIFSVFLDPNFAGAFFVLYFIFTGALFYKNIMNLKYRISTTNLLTGFVLAITLIAIFLTFSRSSLLMLISGSVVFLYLIKKLKFVLFIFAFVLLYGLIISPKFYDENMNLFRMNSSMARIANYATALSIIKDRPFFGVGFNSYRYSRNLYGLKQGWVDAPSHADAGVDNSILFVLATTGAAGLLAFLGMWYIIIKRAWKNHSQRESIQAVVVIASILGLFVHSQFINSFFYPPIMLWIWINIGLLEN